MQITAEIWEGHGYLWTQPATENGCRITLALVPLSKMEDLLVLLYKEEEKQAILSRMQLQTGDLPAISRGDHVHKRLPIEAIVPLIRRNVKARELRQKALERAEQIQYELHKLYLRDERTRRKNPPSIGSDIIASMDGSRKLWLMMLLMAKNDFLEYHSNPTFRVEWEDTKLEDLLDAKGKLRRGYEEVYAYITAKGLLFDDNYEIDIDPHLTPCPECNPDGLPEPDVAVSQSGHEVECPTCHGFRTSEGSFGGWLRGSFAGKTANLATILENLCDSLPGQERFTPSLEHNLPKLRSVLSRNSGDPKFIAKYCLPEDLNELDV